MLQANYKILKSHFILSKRYDCKLKSIEHQWIALTFKPIVTWLAPWKASQLKLTSFIKECMSSMRTACGLAHFTRMDLSNSFAWVVSIHLFILNRITEGGLFSLDILYWVNQYSTKRTLAQGSQLASSWQTKKDRL